MIVVDTEDALLMMPANRVGDLNLLIKKIKNVNAPEIIAHKDIFRPWGKFETVNQGTRHQVKKITVNPKEKLSLQKHKFRAEHWVVVKGVATVTKGKEQFDLRENESTYIQAGEVHSLENRQDSELEIIEVQSGDYLGEDDIIRIEDRYGRS